MDLEQTYEGRRWVCQFAPSDRPLAITLLRNLRLISHPLLLLGIRNTITGIARESDGRIALYSVRGVGSPGREAGHIIPLLENMAGESSQFIVEPAVKQLRAERIKTAILVDDYLVSGSRLTEFWYGRRFDGSTSTETGFGHPSIKSWCSSQHLRPCVVAYAIDPKGVASVCSAVKSLKPENFYSVLDANSRRLACELKGLCIEYALRTAQPSLALGYRQSFSTAVFQDGCPNNVPAILHVNGKQWMALFPGGKIPAALMECFASDISKAVPDAAWNMEQTELALRLLVNCGKPEGDDIVVAVLDLLSRRMQPSNLAAWLGMDDGTITRCIQECHELGFLDARSGLTALGMDILGSFRGGKPRSDYTILSRNKNKPYIPPQFMGSYRTSSDGL